ncbi:MAG: T9SS type A sorting domain-containing protein [Bacteroidales bacterium]|jgi:hypothetical protein|nr:T9SS type A sorting domain-containing protein [Bacteroidales bacterium]
MKKKLPSIIKLVLLVVILTQVINTQAQRDYHKQIDNIFDIPAVKIPSGILIDRSPELLDMNGYNPANNPKTDTCHLFDWLCIYYRLYASHLYPEDFKYDLNIANQYLSVFKPKKENIPLGIIYFNYDRLKKNAVDSRLLQVDTLNQKVRDLSGAGNPTEPATCFAFSPMADTISAGNHQFHIDPTLFVSNKTKEFSELYIDFDDGRGYIRVFLNETVTASYFTLGNKTLKVKAILGKETLVAYAGLYISENHSLMLSPATPVAIPTPDVGPTKFPNNGIDAYFGIWYRCNHNNTIHKPILIVSGFDPQNKNRIGNEKSEGVEEKVYLYNIANKNGFLDRLREFGYDIIIYRSDNSTKSIIPNAMNLVNFIKTKVNDAKTSENELIVIGVSMGGLVCRYALSYMEQPSNNFDHKTKLFISMDSPQNGANVPLGFQYMAKYLNQNLGGSVEILKTAMEDMLDSDAAKEMLLYHHTNTSNLTASCATNRTTFLNNLTSVGNFPKKCQTMALSMGSGNGTNQGFAAGASLIKKHPSPVVFGTYMLLDVLLSLLGIPSVAGLTLSQSTWEIDVRAVPNQTKGTIYREELYLHICVPRVIFIPFLGPIIVFDCAPHLIDRKEEVNNTQPVDNASGSFQGFHNLKSMNLKGFDDILKELKIISVDSHYDCFIPSYSALGMNITPQTNIKSFLNTSSGATKINDNLYFITNKSVSLFDYLYIENKNLDHIYDDNKVSVLTPAMLIALDNMISSKNLHLENKTIVSGQSVAYEAAETIIADNNFIVEFGGKADMKAPKITLKQEFRAKNGSTVRLRVDNSWVCPPGTIKSVSLYPLSDLLWDNVQETPNYSQDYLFVEEINQPLVQEMKNRITVFPNPVENILNLKIENRIDGDIKISIVDYKGQVVYSQTIMNDLDNAINCSQFISGVYFVTIESKDITQTLKIIKK